MPGLIRELTYPAVSGAGRVFAIWRVAKIGSLLFDPDVAVLLSAPISPALASSGRQQVTVQLGQLLVHGL